MAPDDGVPAVRFSQAALWRRHHAYYATSGVTPWSTEVVPTHAPNNAYIAEAHARVCAAILLEHASLSGPPIHLVELGAGTGYFAWLLLDALRRRVERTGERLPPFRYVLTDISDDSRRFWRDHPRLRPLFASGVLDCARYDVAHDDTIQLDVSGERLGPDRPAAPLLVFANYLLDSLPADVFRVVRGSLEEGRVPPALERVDGEPGGDLAIPYQFGPATRYDDPELDAIIDGYAGRLGDTSLTMPVGAIGCVRRLARLAGGQLYLFATDKGYTELTNLHGVERPAVMRHGDGISMTVNFDALGRYVSARGGHLLATRERSPTLAVALLGTGAAAATPAIRIAFEDGFERSGPIDVFHVVVGALDAVTTVPQCLSLLRLACDDPWVFHRLVPRLRTLVARASDLDKRQLRRVMRRVHELYFAMPEGEDTLFDLGMLYVEMQRHAEAEALFLESLEHHGPHAATYFNLGLCRFHRGDLRDALRLFDTALALDHGFAPAREWRLRMVAELGS